MKKQVFTLNGKKYYSEEEYISARNKFLNYQTEEELAVAEYGFAKEAVILSGDDSEVIKFNNENK